MDLVTNSRGGDDRQIEYMPEPDEISRRVSNLRWMKDKGFRLAFIERVMARDDPPIEEVVNLVVMDDMTTREIERKFKQ